MTESWLVASFTAPENITANPQSMLWILPLAAAIAITYKAAKLPKITVKNFIQESVSLFLSIVVFLIVVGVVLITLTSLITE